MRVARSASTAQRAADLEYDRIRGRKNPKKGQQQEQTEGRAEAIGAIAKRSASKGKKPQEKDAAAGQERLKKVLHSTSPRV